MPCWLHAERNGRNLSILVPAGDAAYSCKSTADSGLPLNQIGLRHSLDEIKCGLNRRLQRLLGMVGELCVAHPKQLRYLGSSDARRKAMTTAAVMLRRFFFPRGMADPHVGPGGGKELGNCMRRRLAGREALIQLCMSPVVSATLRSRSLSSSRVSQRGKSPTFSADGAGAGIFAQPPEWPPPGAKTSVEWSKLTGTSPFLFGHPATGAVRVATDTVPFGQRVSETLPVPRSTGGKEEEKSEGVCHFSEYESHGEGSPAESEEDGTGSEEEPEDVLEVTPKLDSGSTTPTKPRPVPAPNVRACSKSSPRRPKIKRLKSPGDTPGREVVVRQNATDLMDEEVQRWVVAAAEPKKELFFY